MFFGFLYSQIILTVAEHAYAQVEFLNQNWTPEVWQTCYNLSQVSPMMPYDWFTAMEGADSDRKQLGVTTKPKLSCPV